MKIKESITRASIFIVLLTFFLNKVQAATITSSASGNWSSASTWAISLTRPGTVSSSTSSNIVTGSALASFTTTLSVGSQILNTSNVVIGTVASIESATSLTLVANATSTLTNAGWNSRGVGPGDAVTISVGHTVTVDANYTCASLSFATATTSNVLTLSGTNTLTVTGAVSMPNPSASMSSVINVNNGTLSCGSLSTSGTTATRFTNINITNGILDINGTYTSANAAGAVITISGTGTINFGGAVSTLFTLTPGTSSTIRYDMNGAQTCRPITYNNLILGGTGIKTVTSCTVNNILQIDSTATLSTSITYGASASLIYNTKISRTVSLNEWPATFTATGGVQINNTGAITLNAAKIFNLNVPLTINAGATLITSNFALTFNGNFINNGTLTAGSSAITIAGTATQSIGNITTTGAISLTKTANTATFNSNISAGSLVLNGSGGTLSLGSGGYSHSFTTVTFTAGTLSGGNSTTSISSNLTKSVGSTFTPETSTINFSGTNQTIALEIYYNLIFSGSGSKTISISSIAVTNDLTTKASAIFTSPSVLNVTGSVKVEDNSKLIVPYNLDVTGNLTVGNGSAATFEISTATGGKTISGNFTIASGATYNNTADENLSIGGNFIINGSATFGLGQYQLTGSSYTISSSSPVSIPNLNISGFYYNNTNLTITGSLIGTGTLENMTNATLNLSTNTISISNLNVSNNNNTVVYSLSGAQTVYATKYYHLTLSGSGVKTIPTSISTILGNFGISGSNTSTNFLKGVIIKGNVTVSSSNTFLAGNYSHYISGNITLESGGIADWTNSTLILDGGVQNYTDANTVPYSLNNINAQGNRLKTLNVKSITGNVNIANGDSLAITNNNLSILGILNIGSGSSGYFEISNANATKNFKNDVIINTNAVFNNKHTDVIFSGNLTCDGDFYSGSGTYTFDGTNKTISGNSSISLINLIITGTVSNLGRIAVGGTFSGTGTFTNSNVLFLTGLSTPTISKLDASKNVNTVYYSGINSQTLYGTNYYNLDISGTGLKSFPNVIDTIKGNLSISGSTTYNSTDNLVVLGNFSISSSASINLGSYSYFIGGNIDFGSNSTYDVSNATITLNGTTQSINNYTSSTLSIAYLTLSGGIKTLTHNTYITSKLTINSDASLNIGPTSTLHLVGTIDGLGTIMGGTCNSPNSKSISFEARNTFMGTAYIDNTYNNFYRIYIYNNASVFIKNDCQIYDNLNLTNGIITVWNNLYLSTSNSPITRSSGFLNMASSSSLTFGGCNNLGSNFTLPTNIFLTPPQLVNFTIQRTAGINIGTNTMGVTGTLNLLNGNLQTNGLLTLMSNANGTARVSPIDATASISGNVTTERYIPGGSNKRKWRLISFPINVSGSVSILQLKDNILITAPAGSTAGFDVNPFNPTNTASLRTYNESTSGAANLGWTDPSSINATIATGIGFEVFVRGSRNLANPYLNWTIPDDVTLNYTGELNTGTKTINLSYTNSGNSTSDGFNLIGNPYASPINFDTTAGWTKTNIQNKFWSYNPNTGAYGVYDADLHIGTNSITRYIASSQGFFVKATGSGTPSITFTENVKCINSGNNYFKPTINSQNNLSMLKIGISNDSLLNDETMLVLDENASVVGNDEHDAVKWFSDALNIYTLSKDNINLNIDARNYPTSIDTIPLAVYSYNGSEIMSTHHQLNFSGLETIPASIDVVLWDNYLKTYTNCRVYNQYDFTITTENTSYGKNRFALLLGDVNIGINANHISNKIIAYPNPTSKTLNIATTNSWENKEYSYKIFDQAGRTILAGNSIINHLQSSIDVSSLQLGMYWIEINTDNNIERLKFIKQ